MGCFMKKRILLLILMLLLTTGCTCQYNLTIENNTYKEEIIIYGENNEETSNFNKKWEIPVNKEEYHLGGEAGVEKDVTGDVYKYNLSGNKLTFNYDFTRSDIIDSSAVSNCYNKLTIVDYEDTIVISTSSKAMCYNRYPTLNNLKINIKVDKPVISNNADNVNGNIYTWNITKDNADDKSINIILDNKKTVVDDEPKEEDNDEKNQIKKRDYTLYIFLGILLIVVLIAYLIFNKIRNHNNQMDD